jgi:hypothetical protein
VVAGLALALPGCLAQVPAISGPTTVVEWQGQSYPLRIVALDQVPVYSLDAQGREVSPPLMLQQASVRVVAPDKLTAAAVYEWQCRGNPKIDRAAWGDEPVPFDKATGEWIIAGTCA